ncbi:hypothetical protein [Syntrophorhabdus aromaticivorans]|jgi:hypothetical protein|uniref:hypothetical protein n=1 Tax=Syntrophorhabdus aromaticivorans TaxID=328301 RepID=UPI0004076E53|nr:hypothetical protein [Syntrophorhabdus aromaticivorans]
MTVVVLFLVGVYVLLSIGFVKLVEKLTNKKRLYKYLAIALCILLPTWDIVLGMIVYFPACLFVPKVAIYETAETEGIYYEGEHNILRTRPLSRHNEPMSERIRVGLIGGIFQYGYLYGEAKVIEKEFVVYQPVPIAPLYYRCTPLPGDESESLFRRTDCHEIDTPASKYTVKVNSTKFGTSEISIKKIINRSTGRVLAEYRQAALSFSFPFFFWWYKYDGSPTRITCPWDKQNQYYGISRFSTFEYQVLKPKNKKLEGQ